jgi:hypothetical protein
MAIALAAHFIERRFDSLPSSFVGVVGLPSFMAAVIVNVS